MEGVKGGCARDVAVKSLLTEDVRDEGSWAFHSVRRQFAGCALFALLTEAMALGERQAFGRLLLWDTLT
eukprot:COSAG02_NODE_625_length_19372_cov_14.475355_8_plen_69_part_00